MVLFFSTASFSKADNVAAEAIEKAYNLSLQKERTQAITTLMNAAKKENKKGQIPKEMILALNEIAHMFYSDKTQQIYESAVSVRLSDPTAAFAKLTDALKLEPDNLTVTLEYIRTVAARGDCSKALDLTKHLKETFVYLEEIDLLLSQLMVCEGKLTEWMEFRPKDFKKSELNIYWHLVLAEAQFKKNDIAEMKNTLSEAARIDDQHPQIQYWTWKMQNKEDGFIEKSGTKYILECRKLSSRKQRFYLQDPFLCRYVNDVENLLKKNNNPK